MFDKVKDLYNLQKQAKQVKKELAAIHIEAEVDGVVAVVSAEQEIISITIPDELLAVEKKTRLTKAIIEATKKATKKAQEIAAEKMKGIMGGMGFPGM
ncbi:MAG: YbaB/EbfC family nucleoid-associated protein [Candidatus Peregrinibacteria bacterium]